MPRRSIQGCHRKSRDVAGLVGSGDFRTRREPAQRKAVGDTLGGAKNVWLDAEMLDCKHFPRAGETSLHFVADEKNTVFVENFLYFFEVVRRRNDDAAFSPNWLRDERRDVAGGRKTNYIF